jgi:hypothetical protein
MPNFDIASPSGSDLRGEGANVIRTLKLALQYALRGGKSDGEEGKFPGSNPSISPIFRYRGGKGSTADIPPANNGGLYINTNRNSVQRSNGTGWEDVGTHIPSGTVMCFYQVTAPTSWTNVASNDRFLRVVSSGSSGGINAGTFPASSSLGHTHDIGYHIHGYGHYHDLDHSDVSLSTGGTGVVSNRTKGASLGTYSGTGSSWDITNRTLFFIDDDVLSPLELPSQTTGAALSQTLAYCDVVFARKD